MSRLFLCCTAAALAVPSSIGSPSKVALTAAARLALPRL
jgi:hypothetical protein